MTYDAPKPGKWVQPRRKNYLMACCDCGLVHKMEFRMNGRHIQFRAWRNTKATYSRRKRERIVIRDGKKGKSNENKD